MRQVQQLTTPADVQSSTSAHFPRLFFSLLVGLAITLILTLLEMGILWLLNPFHVLGSNALAALIALPLHVPQSLLVPLVEFVGISLAVLVAAKPLALLSYLREVHAAQKQYHQLYMPLTVLTNIRKTSDTDQQSGASSVLEERITLLDLVQQQETNLLILGVPGAGKTMALRVYQYLASQHPWKLVLRRKRIPIYAPMKNYSLFLKTRLQSASENGNLNAVAAEQQGTLLDFLYESDLPGMHSLRPYLYQLSQQGRLLLLCDGLNEVDSNYLSYISNELVRMMRDTRNRVVTTCREVDYRKQEDLIQLVNEGYTELATVYPLQNDQVNEFVERYVERQDNHWRHTAGQIMQVIDRSRLRYLCANPMMLFMLMGIIDTIGVERGKQIDTRGLLLREYVKQLIKQEQEQPKWSRGAPEASEVIRFLSEVASAARWANDRNAIQLRVATPGTVDDVARRANIDELVDELQYWLDEHPPQSPFVPSDELASAPYENLAQLLEFALSAALIEVSPNGVLSFRHELIAEYFLAEYFYAADNKRGASPLRTDLLENVGIWSELVAIWAGLLDNPLTLAERFGELGRSNRAYVLQALALSLVCVGVLWTPPQAEKQQFVELPPRVGESLTIAIRNRAAREELAHLFTRCAQEGGQEVYRSLLSLLLIEGVDELLILLDSTIVPELLFTQLLDAVDNVAYEAQVKRLTYVLGRFGSVVVSRAAELSQPAPERTIRLRAAAINILGGTADSDAVEPLVARLSDAEPLIVSRAASALVRLGPEITLTRVLQELENRQQGPFTKRVHQEMLFILTRFVDEQDTSRQVSIMQYQRILDGIVPVLTSDYQSEPEVQQQAREILVHQAQKAQEAGIDNSVNRSERIIEALMRYLPSQDDVAVENTVRTLEEIGSVATPRLLELLQQTPQETVRIRIIDIFNAVRDLRALPALLKLLEDSSPTMQQHGTSALLVYVPESIPGLISLVLRHPDDIVASKAAQILSTIGEQVVLPVTDALPTIVPGRTRLLVQVLERLGDPRSLEALMDLLRVPQLEPLLIIAIVRALGQFSDRRIVSALLVVLSDFRPQVYEEAIDALSQLGEIAVDELVDALNVQQETVVTQRVQRALLGMVPFPGEALLAALAQSGDAQAQHILTVFKRQGPDAAMVLVRHLLHRDERTRSYIQQTLNDMPGAVVVPALLDVLDQPALFREVRPLLLKYSEAAIPPLVELLGERERGDASAALLPQFGSTILRPLLAGLEDSRSMAREHTERIVVELVRQSQEKQAILREIVSLFAPPLPPRAHEFLLELLTNELANASIPALLEGLEDAHLMNDSADALVRMIHKGPQREMVLDNLLAALYREERRRGAEDALIRTGAEAVPSVVKLIADKNQSVAVSAKHILGNIGVPALSFIWMTLNDKSNASRREAALEVFQSMPTSVIKDELVILLNSDRSEDIAMAVALLVERIHDESVRHYADHEMIPELLTYVQMNGATATNLRILALLLLLGQQAILDHLIQALDDDPRYPKQLAYMFLLLGPETHQDLLDVFNDPATATELRADLAAILAMVSTSDVVSNYAQNLSSYGLSAPQTPIQAPEQLALAQRALGGLLASGQWNDRKLQELLATSKEGSPTHELFGVLLGLRYEPQIAQLRSDLQAEREAYRKESIEMMERIVSDQAQIRSLKDELDQVNFEHDIRGDELHQTTQEKDALHKNLEQIQKENDTLNDKLNRALQENQTLRNQLRQLNPSNKP